MAIMESKLESRLGFCLFAYLLLLLFIVFAYSKIRKVLTVVLARSPSWSPGWSPGWSPSSSPDFDVSFSLSFRDRNSRQVAVSCDMSMQVS